MFIIHIFLFSLFYFFHYILCPIVCSVIDMSYQLFVRVSDQHESLCYFGH